MREPIDIDEAEMDRILQEQHIRAVQELEDERREKPSALVALEERIQLVAAAARKARSDSPRPNFCQSCFGVEIPQGEHTCGPCLVRREQAMAERRSAAAAAFTRSLPWRYRGAAADNPEVLAWLESDKDRGLLLVGDVGRGKTWQMFGAARELVARGFETVGWVFVPDLLRDLRPGGPRSAPDGMDDLYQADVLLLDDLAAHKPSEWAEAELGILLDRRWRDGKPCIITTNVPPGILGGVLGPRIASRLAGSCTVVALAGPDRRKQVQV